MKKILAIVLLFNCSMAFGQKLNIVPAPAEVKMGKGFSILKSPVMFSISDTYNSKTDNGLGYELFVKYIKQTYGITLLEHNGPPIPPTVGMEITFTDAGAGKENGYYELEIADNRIQMAFTEGGEIYAFETLKQMVTLNAKKQLVVPNCTIVDYPRFKYRGMHLDVCRHFFPVSFVKKYIDYLAAYKFNKFHWHLTDDQGWRIEIKKYPELISVGSKRNGTIIGRYPGKGSDNKPYGGFYTQEEIKEVVQYAKERYIDVIPEIEMPGHSSAAIAAYPWLSCFPVKPTEIPANMISQKSIDEQKAGRIKLVQETWGVFDDVFCAGKDSTFLFLENVLDEVLQLFPSKYIHIGGDESPKTHWKICPACQQRIKDGNLKDEHELQSYFVQRIEKYLNSKGRTIIGWDEILEGGLAPNAVVMSWRGETGGIEAAKQKHQVIMTPGNPVYFDHTQSKNEDSVTIGGYNPIENVYAWDPIPKELDAVQGKYILGAQANMWAEYFEYPSKVEYMLFPRITALSEVLWSPKEKRDWKDFERRLPVIFERLDKQKINYSKAYYDLKATVLPAEGNDAVIWSVATNNNNAFINSNGAFKNGKNITDTISIFDAAGEGRGGISYLYKKRGFDIEARKVDLRITEQNSVAIAEAIDKRTKQQLSIVGQIFHFNKATGKKITLVTQPSKSYPGDGAFTLVNGVQNEKGMSKTSEFLGFNGTDLDATIDLDGGMDINKVTIHVLDQNGSWIYLPAQIEITYIPNVDYTEDDLKNFPKEVKMIDPIKDKGIKTISIESKQNCRYIKVVAKNYGIIPSGNPGAGNPAWLFVDEIEVH